MIRRDKLQMATLKRWLVAPQTAPGPAERSGLGTSTLAIHYAFLALRARQLWHLCHRGTR